MAAMARGLRLSQLRVYRPALWWWDRRGLTSVFQRSFQVLHRVVTEQNAGTSQESSRRAVLLRVGRFGQELLGLCPRPRDFLRHGTLVSDGGDGPRRSGKGSLTSKLIRDPRCTIGAPSSLAIPRPVASPQSRTPFHQARPPCRAASPAASAQGLREPEDPPAPGPSADC